MTEPFASVPEGYKEEYFSISKTSIGIIEHEVMALKRYTINCQDTKYSYERIMGILDRLKGKA